MESKINLKKIIMEVPIEISDVNTNNKAFAIYAHIKNINNKKILVADLYSKSDLISLHPRATYRIFFEQNDYVTIDLKSPKPKWLTSRLEMLIEHWQWHKEIHCLDDSTLQNLREFFSAHGCPFLAIGLYQKKIMKKRLLKRHLKIINRIDEIMSPVPKLPYDFEKWINETVLLSSRYIFYKYENKMKLNGFCSYCHNDVEIENARHNAASICPSCQSKVILKAQKKASQYLEDRAIAAIIQKYPNGIIVRYFNVIRTYRKDRRHPTTSYYEEMRDIYIEGSNSPNTYYWGNFRNSGAVRWCEEPSHYISNAVLYNRNIESALQNTKWKYSALDLLVKHQPNSQINIRRFFDQYLDMPFIEYLIKMKLYRFVHDLLDRQYSLINLKGRNLKEILLFDSDLLSSFRTINPDVFEMSIFITAKEEDIKITNEQVEFMSELFSHSVKENLKILAECCSIHKSLQYLKSQQKDNQISSDVFSDWKDYIRFCKEMKYDTKNLFVRFPRNLEEEHNRLTVYVLEKKENLNGNLFSVIPKLYSDYSRKYTWKYGKYEIRPPATAGELLAEGHILHHCVGTYIKSVAKKESVILFIRKSDSPNTPFFTMEIKNNKIVQCRGKYNKSSPSDISNLTKKFEKTILNQTKISERRANSEYYRH